MPVFPLVVSVADGRKAVVGIGLLTFGGIFIYGGVTGRLSPMLAALFYPQILTPATGSAGSSGYAPFPLVVPPSGEPAAGGSDTTGGSGDTTQPPADQAPTPDTPMPPEMPIDPFPVPELPIVPASITTGGSGVHLA